MAILQDVTSQALLDQIEALKAENAKLKAAKQGQLRMKISDKGCVSLYGLNVRFPVSLYRNQWLRLLDHSQPIRDFLEDNAEVLDEHDENNGRSA